MARFTDIPNEITLMIIPLIHPDDIESFTSTCWSIYVLAAEDLERHRALKRKHAVYQWSGSHRSFSHCSPSRLLNDVLQEPLTAFYVRKISILNTRRTWSLLGNRETECLPYSERSISRLSELISELVPEGSFPSWLDFIRSGSEIPTLSLLLLLLPNLSTLKLQCLGENEECLYRTLRHITNMKGAGTPLSRLRHVKIPHSLKYDGLKLVKLFAALPSIKSIHGLGIRADDPELHWEVEQAPRTSNLEDLTLTSCRLSSKRLFDLLEGFRVLRSFTYDSDRTSFRLFREAKLEPFWIRSAVFAFTRSTLESFTFLSHDSERRFMGDIRGFEAIRHLHTETQLLLHESKVHRNGLSLARALPRKLQTLKLVCSGPGDEVDIARWISGLVKLKKECVPDLRRVELFTRNGVKDFENRLEYVSSARRQGAILGTYHSYEALVEECKNSGFDLLVEALDTGNLEAGTMRNSMAFSMSSRQMHE